MDKLYSDPTSARNEMIEGLLTLKEVHKVRPSSYNIQLFFVAKSDEIINLFTPAPAEEKERIISLLRLLDPGNIQKYDNMMS
jgi:hypothetical protein